MLTFEDCLAFADIDPNDLLNLRDLSTISALRAAIPDGARRPEFADEAARADRRRASRCFGGLKAAV